MDGLIQSSYNAWSRTYDTGENRTRDLAAKAIRAENLDLRDKAVLELGCGTGANTGYLAEHAHSVTAMDFSSGMLTHARANVSDSNVHFIAQDLNQHWNVGSASFDLIVCTLVLEHIENLEHIFREARRTLRSGGEFIFCELHPFRQLIGGQAQFKDQDDKTMLIPAFLHNVSDYLNTALDAGFEILRLEEFSDEEDKANNALPRLLAVHIKTE
jgi:ubiquinone/menaquinone biosynthesis C-methylase UbiE